jgi:outer membrane receptor protein involved in Fe transport
LGEDFEQLSQELRLLSPRDESFEYVLGIYLQKSTLDSMANTHVSLLQVNAAQAALGVPEADRTPAFAGTRASEFDQQSHTVAVFAETSWMFDPQWKLNLGLRLSQEKKTAEKTQVLAHLGQDQATADPFINGVWIAALNSQAHELLGSREETRATPNISIQYMPSNPALSSTNPLGANNYYGSITKGFKGGGFDAVLGNGDANTFEYEDEVVMAYELGAKWRLPGQRAAFNLALFRSDFDDLQVSMFDGSLGFNVANAGKARSQGIEFDLDYQLNQRFSFGGAFAYLDSQYIRFNGGQCYVGQTEAQGCVDNIQDLSGKETLYSPKYAANLYLRYTQALAKDKQVLAQILSYYSDAYHIANDLDPQLKEDASVNINAQLELRFKHAAIALIGKNLGNHASSTQANDIPLFQGSYSNLTNRPRSIALQLAWRF